MGDGCVGVGWVGLGRDWVTRVVSLKLSRMVHRIR